MLLLIDTRAKGFRIAPPDGLARIHRAAASLWRQRNLLVWQGQRGSGTISLAPGAVKIRARGEDCHAYKCLLNIYLRTGVRRLRGRIAMNTDTDIYCGPIGFH